MIEFIKSLQYNHWLVIIILVGLAIYAISKIFDERKSGVEQNGTWVSYKDLFDRLGEENLRLSKTNESLVSMNNKMVLELKECARTIETLSNEKANLQDRLGFDADIKSHIQS